MFDGISPSDPTVARAAVGGSDVRAGGVQGRAEVGLAVRAGQTRLAHLYQHDPLRVLFPYPAPGDPLTVIPVTTSGGLVGGDALDVSIALAPGAEALVVPQAAEKVYRSSGADCRVSVTLEAATGASLEWLPQETILFDGARLRRVTIVEAAPGARVLAGEILVLGRLARGERLTHGLIRECWTVRRAGRPVWADALHLDGDIGAMTRRTAVLDGAAAFATAIYVADDAPAELTAARHMLGQPEGVRAAATAVNGVLVMRWIAADPGDLRAAFAAFWCGFRAHLFARPAVLPRLWQI